MLYLYLTKALKKTNPDCVSISGNIFIYSIYYILYILIRCPFSLRFPFRFFAFVRSPVHRPYRQRLVYEPITYHILHVRYSAFVGSFVRPFYARFCSLQARFFGLANVND